MESRSVNSAQYDALDFLPGFYTTAVPTELSSEQLDGVGFRKQYVVRIDVKSLNFTNCRAFHNEYLERWWATLGQQVDNIEFCESSHFQGTRGDLMLTYRLREPVHLAKISHIPTFDFIAPAPTYCIVHNQDSGRLTVDPPTETQPFSVIRNTYCCSRIQTIKFRCTLLGREMHF